MPNISQLPFLSSLDGTEEIPIRKGATTYATTTAVLSQWTISGHGINRPPTSQGFTPATDDTVQQLTGNILVGASDPDGDAFFIQSLSYNGTAEGVDGGSFQTTYGIFFLNSTTGNWTFTLGPSARALTNGQTVHEIFTYTIADGRGGLSTSTLNITITGTNSVPVVNAVNGAAPINTTISGNLIANYSFDYEPTPLSILHYVIDGIVGTWSAGTAHTISGVGTITIDSNGDYTFVPVTDFFGAVPTITYTITDGGNNVDTYLRLAITPLISGTAPIVIMTDTESCPNMGGVGGNGGYLSIIGFRFGTSGGLGTTTRVKIGGVEVAAYLTLEDHMNADIWPGMQHLRVQVGTLATLTSGKPYPVTVEVSGQASNASFNFTPNPGRILFVSLTGNNATAVADDVTKPWRNFQMPNRGDPSIYNVVRAGDQVVARGGDWSNDVGYDTALFRFRDPTQQGSSPTGASGTGWIGFVGYPNETFTYLTKPGNKGGFQGPGSAFEGTCGDWVYFSNMHLGIGTAGGAASDGAPINLQSMSERARIVNNNLGPWPAGDSAFLNAACVTGQGLRVVIACNHLHDIEGTSAQQNHGIYGGTSAQQWTICFNKIENCIGGSGIQFNDSEGGTNTKNTKFGIWPGFVGMNIHHNWINTTAKYGITFSDVGAYQGDLSGTIWNNIVINTGLSPFRTNTTTATTDLLYAFNTSWNCCKIGSGTGNAIFRNEGVQTTPNHHVRAYNNVLAFGPDTVAGTGWYFDYAGSGAIDFKRNVYFANGQTPTAASDSLAVIGDPLFTNAAAFNFALQSGSPAVNAGTQALSSGLIVDDDFTGLATRQFGGAPDCGALEVGQTTPYVISAPVATGAAKVGVSVSTTRGGWGNSPTSYLLQYTLDGVNAGSSGTGSTLTFTPAAGDERKTLRCVISATNGSGTTVYTVTVGVVLVGTGAPVNTVPPAITGTVQSGFTLTSSTGTWTVATGTISGYSYQWKRNGIAVSGATSSTYALGSPDVGYQMSCDVYANDSTTGSPFATTTSTSAVLPAAANPVFVQTKTSTLRSDTTAQAIVMDSDVQGNNLLITFCGAWDQHTYNLTFSDTQGHSSGASSWATAGDLQVQSNNPCINAEWLKANATGTYTQSINTNGSQGGVAIIVEVTGIDPTTIMDLPSYNSTGSNDTPALSGAIANTKPNDLVYVMVGVAGASGATCTTPSGWTSRGSISGGFQTMFLFERKETTVETFAFSATLDSNRNWGCISLVVKGS